MGRQAIEHDVMAKQYHLSDRQQLVIEYIAKHGGISIQQFEEICPDVTRRTLQRELKELIQGDDRFNFLGKVPHQQLAHYYRQADLTVVPSLCYENSPKVIDESLVANVPVLAADIGGVPEIIKDDYNGYTFVPGNEENLVQVLNHFLSHPEKIEELKKNSFVSVHNLSINNYIKKLLSSIG